MISSNNYVVVTKGVSVPGTAEQCSSLYILEGMPVTVTNRRDASGNMYVGFSQTDAQTSATRKILVPGQSADFYVDNLNKLWVDADSAGDLLELSVPKRP